MRRFDIAGALAMVGVVIFFALIIGLIIWRFHSASVQNDFLKQDLQRFRKPAAGGPTASPTRNDPGSSSAHSASTNVTP